MDVIYVCMCYVCKYVVYVLHVCMYVCVMYVCMLYMYVCVLFVTYYICMDVVYVICYIFGTIGMCFVKNAHNLRLLIRNTYLFNVKDTCSLRQPPPLSLMYINALYLHYKCIKPTLYIPHNLLNPLCTVTSST
jgi:hypothetical protein